MMAQSKNILVTGGAGYIGSHICVALINDGFTPIIVDDLSNAHVGTLDNIGRITGVTPLFYQMDICNQSALYDIFTRHDISTVIHLAAKKAVEESVQNPLAYYNCNIDGLLSVLAAMSSHRITDIIYSSSATVYAPTAVGIYDETAPLQPANPYGWTKFMGEQIIADVAIASPLCAGILRYFNPVGAHQSGLIGENPKGKPNNLMPLVAQVANSTRTHIAVYGGDYHTPDGTAIRDFVHVMDVAEAHVKALRKLKDDHKGFILNIGTGQGHSVLDIIKTYERVSGFSIPYQIYYLLLLN
ncbi:MAG: UDP-glucose 4-epimerase GalE, partial [Pseudomonadota bacterium]